MRKTDPSEQLSFGQEFDAKPTHSFFFAIRPNEAATDDLTQLIGRLRDAAIMWGRPVNANRLHVTLNYLGDFGDQIPPSLVPAAQAVAATLRMQPFDVAFDRVGGTRGPFLLRASDESASLRAFQRTLSVALKNAGLRDQIGSAFNPHVTLSYDFSDAPEQAIEPIGWTVRRFILIESLIGRGRHVERGRWPLHG